MLFPGRCIPNNQHASQRILPNPRAQRHVRERNIRRLLILCPSLQLVADENNVVLAPIDLGEVRFERGLAQVPLARFDQGRFVVFQPVSTDG